MSSNTWLKEQETEWWLEVRRTVSNNVTTGGNYYMVWIIENRVIVTDDTKRFSATLLCDSPTEAQHQSARVKAELAQSLKPLWVVMGIAREAIPAEMLRYEQGRMRAFGIKES